MCQAFLGLTPKVISMLLEDGQPALEAEFLGTQSITVG
jgi:hypothetical protein